MRPAKREELRFPFEIFMSSSIPHLWNLNFLFDVHTIVGLGLRVRLRWIANTGSGRRQLRLRCIQETYAAHIRTVDLSADRLQGDLSLPQNLQFTCSVTFVHRSEFVSSAAHSIGSHSCKGEREWKRVNYVRLLLVKMDFSGKKNKLGTLKFKATAYLIANPLLSQWRNLVTRQK